MEQELAQMLATAAWARLLQVIEEHGKSGMGSTAAGQRSHERATGEHVSSRVEELQ